MTDLDAKLTARRMINMHGRKSAAEWAWEHAFANRMNGNRETEWYWLTVKAEIEEMK